MLDRSRYTERPAVSNKLNPFKRTHRVRDEANLPADVQEMYQRQILDLVLYDPEECKALRDFESVQMNTHCLFAKKAVLWGARDYEQSLSVGECVGSSPV